VPFRAVDFGVVHPAPTEEQIKNMIETQRIHEIARQVSPSLAERKAIRMDGGYSPAEDREIEKRFEEGEL
jgi:hypothetical protein